MAVIIPPPAPAPLPSWYEPEAQAAAAQVAPNAPLPDWYEAEPETVTVTGEAPDTGLRDAAANVGTGLARIPGAVIGAPHMLAHTGDWLTAQLTNLVGLTKDATGADFDKYNPLAIVTPSSDTIDKGVFKGISAVAGHDVQPYEPTSFMGKLAQAAITGAGAGLLDPVAFGSVFKSGGSIADAMQGAGGRMAKTAIASDAANATQQAFPDSPGLAAAAALVAHSGAGMASRAASSAYHGTLPLTRPSLAADRYAGKALSGVDNSQPGLAQPSSQQIGNAATRVTNATDDIGPGLDNYDAGGNIRSGLQSRADALKAQRSAVADEAYTAFRDEVPLEGAKLAGFVNRPGFQAALKSASGAVLDEGGKPLTDFLDFNSAGDPMIRPNAAITTDALERIKGKLDDAVTDAKPGTRSARTASMLRDQFVALLDKEYPNTYPKTRSDFAAASRPLDPLETGPNAKVLDSHTSYGQRTYTMPQDKIAGTFLKAGDATRSAYDNLIAGFGGDKASAMGALEQNLASKVAGAVNGDGTLSLEAFNRAVRPYRTALNMWFPELSQKFATAEGAQKSLERLRSQDTLAQSVREHGLRDDSGVVTQDSALSWITKNEKALAATQAPAAIMRLKQIASALPKAPTAVAEAAVEGAPAAAGFALGGAESGIFGSMFHAIPRALAGPSFAKFNAAYSAAIERAFSDPIYAARLSKGINTRPKGVTPMQAVGNAVMEDLKKGLIATPSATIAGQAPRTNLNH